MQSVPGAPTPPRGSGRPPGLALLRAVAWLAGLALVAALVGRLHGLMIEDDAFIFVRYANNLLHHGIFAWNPRGPASYGTTSILYTLIVTIVRLLAGASPARVIVLSSLLCAVVFVVLTTIAVRRQALPASTGGRVALAAFFLLPAAWSSGALTAHAVTGMDTMFALAWLALVILAAGGFERQPGRPNGVWLALATGSAFFARPDLLVFTLPLLAAFVLRPPGRTGRPSTLRIAAASVALTALGCALAWAVLGSPVPLAFYVKGVVRYGGDLEASYAKVPGQQLVDFARSYGLWALPVVLRVGRDAWRRRWSFSPLESALLCGAVGFIVYYRFFVLQVMPHYQRFYHPVLPALVVLAARSLVELGRGFARPPRSVAWLTGRTRAAVVVRSTAAVALVLPLGWTFQHAVERSRAQPSFFALRATDNLHGSPAHNWPRLQEFAALPDAVVIAATEIGLPGVVFPEHAIIDLSGLNEVEFARHGIDPGALFGAADPPDLVYMPHPDYQLMRRRIFEDANFRRDYEFYPARSLRTVLGIALRKTSPYYDDMRRILYMGSVRRAPPG